MNRKDDYEYKLIRMVDDYLVDNNIWYEDDFIRSESIYEGLENTNLYISFHFRPKNKKMVEEKKYNLLKKVFVGEHFHTERFQNGVKMLVELRGVDKRDGSFDFKGIHFSTTKEKIDKEMN